MATKIEYSIVICSYNPDERILRRCLEAIQDMDFYNIDCEIILVDNNSQPKLGSLSYVQNFLTNTPNSRCIVERKQGLTHARIKGVEEASGKYIAFFDDDNEPFKDYLVSLKSLYKDYPTVVAWGPGNIWVDFIDGFDKVVDISTQEYVRVRLFQERHEQFTTYGNARSWEKYCPYGTGLSVKRSYLVDYIRKVKQEEYSAVGRKGNMLTGGEDLQMVLFCLNQTAAVGVSPNLKINHIIPRKRANADYMKKLMLDISISYHKYVDEVLEEYKEKLIGTEPDPIKFAIGAFLKYIRHLLNNNQIKTLESINIIGLNCGHYMAINKPIPKSVKGVLRLFGLKSDYLSL